MSFEVRLHPHAVKELERLQSRTRDSIVARLVQLSKEFGGPKSRLDVMKLRSERELFRLRVGDYRVVFEFADDVIWVARISHRRETYRGL